MTEDLTFHTTNDGSTTCRSKRFDSTYHSINGAIQESTHIFINAGLVHYINQNNIQDINILEFGFGTGLNAILTYKWSIKNNVKINFHTIEGYPIGMHHIKKLQFKLNIDEFKVFNLFHKQESKIECVYSETFKMTKYIELFEKFSSSIKFQLIFFDVFGSESQPKFWERDFLVKIYNLMSKNSMLVTFGAKGSFKRALKSIGYIVESIPGPPGKREMTRAIKKE